eukprot:scaffold117718_cov75-Phaeocystis_antarctica.AAC.4
MVFHEYIFFALPACASGARRWHRSPRVAWVDRLLLCTLMVRQSVLSCLRAAAIAKGEKLYPSSTILRRCKANINQQSAELNPRTSDRYLGL